eukprot:GAHX01001638.1.p1 GENE.GAHX01001638.1~~GAHX01001638.1.p1  ORF type:complete len:71 (+),score=16.68 GAHX01001638.1:65-277(+)
MENILSGRYDVNTLKKFNIEDLYFPFKMPNKEINVYDRKVGRNDFLEELGRIKTEMKENKTRKTQENENS